MRVLFRTTNGGSPAEVMRRKILSLKQIRASECAKGGIFARNILLKRTQDGVSADGSPFAPYAPSTLRRKKSSMVNLRGDNAFHLLDSLGVTVSGRQIFHELETDSFPENLNARSFNVGFTNPSAKTIAGYLNNGTKRMPAREFVNFSEAEVRRIEKYIGEIAYLRMGAQWIS